MCDTRQHTSRGIRWNGYVYAYVPELPIRRVMIVEDHDHYIIVSDYGRQLYYPSTPVGPQYHAVRIGLGQPTHGRIKKLQDAVKELQCNE